MKKLGSNRFDKYLESINNEKKLTKIIANIFNKKNTKNMDDLEKVRDMGDAIYYARHNQVDPNLEKAIIKKSVRELNKIENNIKNYKKIKNIDRWNKENIDPEAEISFVHGGGKHYIANAIKNKIRGYAMEANAGLGIQVHPVTKSSIKNFIENNKGRLYSYASKSKQYADEPAVFTGKIKAKYLAGANNLYEAGIPIEHMDKITNKSILSFKPDTGHWFDKGVEIDSRKHRQTLSVGYEDFINEVKNLLNKGNL